MSYTLTHMYKDYIKDNDFIEAKLFRDICSDFNIEVMDNILEGKSFNMGNHLSTLSIVRQDRDPRTPQINWGESNKYKKELIDEGTSLYDPETNEGVKWHIYYTDDYYFKYYWRKGKCLVPNKSVYRFDATRGVKGNKEKLINLLKEDELAYLKFKKA
tara:strand:+ start:174 stop:647 length:474 start_codon:yes stop_codon:yes gene_type:complete